MDQGTYHVLMVCTGNICRSPMAAGMLEQGLPEALAKTVSVSSAGTHALHGDRAQPFAIETMRRRGIDISDHRARLVSPALIRAADLIAVMEPLHVSLIRRAVLSAGPNVQLLTAYNPNSEHSEVPDPMGAPLKTYEACADLMQPCIDGLIRSLEQTCL